MAGLSRKMASILSGPIAVIVSASSEPPSRSRNVNGPRNAHPIGTCWSISIPMSSASGSSTSSSSASGTPVIGMAERP